MEIEGLQDRLVTQRPRTNLDKIMGKNSSDGLVRLTHIELAKSITKTSHKVQELKTYIKVISKLIYENNWMEAIDEEL